MRMRLKTKFLRLRAPVTAASLFGDWQVCWVGGWTKNRLSFLAIVESFAPRASERAISWLAASLDPAVIAEAN
jgi:hypothetical protein